MGLPAQRRPWGAPGRSTADDAPEFAIGTALPWMRWTIILTMLLILLAWSVPARMGAPLWPLVVAYAGYNALVELARRRVPGLRSYAWVPYVDLPVAGLLYFLDAEPGGPLFAAFFLAVVTAGICWPPRRTAVYLVAVVAVIVAVAPTLPQWAPTPDQWRQLTSRLVVLVLVGAGTVGLVWRLGAASDAARAMRDQAERLRALDQVRGDFVAAISHDLKTPLTAVRAGLGLLEASLGDRLRPEERGLVETTRRNVERLGILIDDLLVTNQIEAGALRLDRRPVDLRQSVANAVAAVRSLFDEKGQRLGVDLPVPLSVLGDGRRLEQAVTNVLVNAHLHTPPGTRIDVAGRVDGDEVRLEVRDDGLGIPAAEREAVFRPFSQGAEHGSGSGLGLAVVRRLVELHGGQVWIGGGSERGAVVVIALRRVSAEGEPSR